MTTDSQLRNRAELAEQAYDIALEGTESFDEDGVGSALAYLVGAILKDEQVDVLQDSQVESQRGLRFLRELYKAAGPEAEGILRHFRDVKE